MKFSKWAIVLLVAVTLCANVNGFVVGVVQVRPIFAIVPNVIRGILGFGTQIISAKVNAISGIFSGISGGGGGGGNYGGGGGGYVQPEPVVAAEPEAVAHVESNTLGEAQSNPGGIYLYKSFSVGGPEGIRFRHGISRGQPNFVR